MALLREIFAAFIAIQTDKAAQSTCTAVSFIAEMINNDSLRERTRANLGPTEKLCRDIVYAGKESTSQGGARRPCHPSYAVLMLLSGSPPSVYYNEHSGRR